MHISTPVKMGECSTLPLYTPSSPSPEYSCDPACDERTLQRTPGINHSPPTGSYSTKSGKMTVTLFEQENDAEIPHYGRRGLVNGTVYLENRELVSRVVFKIKGKLESTSSEGGAESIELLNDCYILWSGRPEESCSPTLIPFSCVLPSTFNYRHSNHPLPPSYISHSPDIPALFVKSCYSIHVYVERARHPSVAFLTKSKHVKIPFTYYPRTRAHRPIVSNPGLFSTIKISPGEWHQTSSSLRTRPQSLLEPIYTHLFLPAARVYSLTDRIPFHLQLCGPLRSLQNLLMPPFCSDTMIRVLLLRQVSVETRDRNASRSIVLAEGQLLEIPPLAFSPCESQDSMDLNWEGEVRCGNDTSVGGFSAGNVTVKDSIVLDIKPPQQGRDPSPFLSLRVQIPIRLVTDSYLEETDYHDPI